MWPSHETPVPEDLGGRGGLGGDAGAGEQLHTQAERRLLARQSPAVRPGS